MKTIEELSGMSDEELRVMCADLDGWISNGAGYWHKGKYVRALRAEYSDGCGGIGSHTEALPNYPDDLNAAMQLCEALADEGWNCEANMGLNKCWEVIFLRPTTERNEHTRQKFDGSLWEEYYAPADTLAKAIVLAFIATKQYEHI